MKIFVFLIPLALLVSCHKQDHSKDQLRLWYTEPAENWMTEALPIGNGFMGVIFFGGYHTEHLQFSEGSLWAGGPRSGTKYNFGFREGAAAYLSPVRELLAEGKFSQAHELARENLTGIINQSEGLAFGDYGAQQTMGDLYVETLSQSAEITEYNRELNIENATGSVTYKSAGVNYTRTYFGCYPEKSMVYNFVNDAPGGSDYSVRLSTPHDTGYIDYKNGVLRLGGNVKDNNLGFETAVVVKTDGKTSFIDNKLTITGASKVLLMHTAATAYRPSFPDYRENDWLAQNQKTIEKVSNREFDDLYDIHLDDYSNLFNRVSLDLIGEDFNSLPTPDRLEQYASGNDDRNLEALYFQYGRYLMISSSRPGTMPMHLQGKWNNSTNPPWGADYHTNINLQMLYWPSEPTNLAECHIPLIDYIETLVPPGRLSAKTFFDSRGWVVNTMNNAWGYTSPGWDFPWGFFPAGAAWLCRHVWEHYSFSEDTTYLRNTAWPVMEEAALFWVDYLTQDESGYLVSNPSYSPEHGGISTGASMDHQIAWDLLNNCVSALEILGTDNAKKKLFSETRDRILPPAIGSWGQLQEWKEDVDDQENKHRHVSHLYALHPGSMISVSGTPDLAEAARVSLDARGDGGTGWSLAWKINFWSRLHDGNRAHSLIRRLLRPTGSEDYDMMDGGGSYDNLLCAHPPFQLDGNMGGTAGIAEMLLQSHDGIIHILPALPDEWQSGEVRGLRARGGFTVNISWHGGKLKEYSLTGTPGKEARVLYAGNEIKISIPPEGTVEVKSD